MTEAAFGSEGRHGKLEARRFLALRCGWNAERSLKDSKKCEENDENRWKPIEIGDFQMRKRRWEYADCSPRLPAVNAVYSPKLSARGVGALKEMSIGLEEASHR